MKTKSFDNEKDWLQERRGKITGTRLKDLVSKTGAKKIGYYEIIAERVAIPADEEPAMDRGKRLEEYALERFTKETGKDVDGSLVMWMRDDNSDIAISPDGVIGDTEAVEVKCLSSARHVEALLTGKIPNDYKYQVLQYFVVNDKLETLYFVFYDPRITRDFIYFTVKREEVEEDVKKYLALEYDQLADIEIAVNKLTF